MNKISGPIFQLGYVVNDIRSWVDYFGKKIGIGPFFMLPLPFAFTELCICGEPSVDPEIFGEVALSYSGDIMIELIVPGTVRTLYHEHLEHGGEGFHHIGMLAEDYDAQLAIARSANVKIPLMGAAPGVRFAYLENDGSFPGTLTELVEIAPEMNSVFEMIKAATVDWNGVDPIRHLA